MLSHINSLQFEKEETPHQGLKVPLSLKKEQFTLLLHFAARVHQAETGFWQTCGIHQAAFTGIFFNVSKKPLGKEKQDTKVSQPPQCCPCCVHLQGQHRFASTSGASCEKQAKDLQETREARLLGIALAMRK